MLRSGERLKRRESPSRSVSQCSGTSLKPNSDSDQASLSSPPGSAKPTPMLLLLPLPWLLTPLLLLRVAGSPASTVAGVALLLLEAMGPVLSSLGRRSRKMTDRTRFKLMIACQAPTSAWKVLGAYLR